MKKRTMMLITTCIALALAGTASASISVSGETTPLPWGAAVPVIVGTNGVGTLTVDGGSGIESSWTAMGAFGGSGIATVTGSGSSWAVHKALRVGHQDSSSGSLTISDNAVVNSLYYTAIGQDVGATGTLTVDSATLNVSPHYLLVGNLGGGVMHIQNGGVVNVTGYGNIARGTGGSGFAEVSGIGSAWNLTGDLEVGRGGDGTLRIKDGGLVKVGGTLFIKYSTAYVAMETGGQLALADGAGTGDDSIADFLALVDVKDDIRYWNGSAWGNITNATESVDYALSAGIGDLAGYAVLAVTSGSPEVPVFGKTTALPWGSSTNVIVGNNGVGLVTVDGGSDLESNWTSIGAYARGFGIAAVTGSGSSWAVYNALRVGHQDSSSGSLTISDNAVVNSLYYTSIGQDAGATGTLMVDSATLNVSPLSLLVGNEGNGTMYIRNGGVVNVTGYGNIARSTGGSGFAEVSGTGSAWNMTAALEVGRGGHGILGIKDGGLVKVGGALSIVYSTAYIAMETVGQLALADVAGTGDDSIANFLALVDGTDDIRYHNGSVWTNIAVGVEGVDYKLAEGIGDLYGYAVLTVSPPPPPEIGDITIMIDGTDAIIGWIGTNYATYALQSKGDLVIDPSWSDEVTGISGLDGSMSATTTATSAESFFRIIGQ